ncbi:MAG: hypothetical protein H6Q67_1214 [Firmicutes bacterium]|nr:hypothetical protein [Bacillota bacterium]
MVINSVSTNSNSLSYQQLRQATPPKGEPSKADKEKMEAAAKKAGVKITPGQKPSDADIQKLKKAGLNVDIEA